MKLSLYQKLVISLVVIFFYLRPSLRLEQAIRTGFKTPRRTKSALSVSGTFSTR